MKPIPDMDTDKQQPYQQVAPDEKKSKTSKAQVIRGEDDLREGPLSEGAIVTDSFDAPDVQSNADAERLASDDSLSEHSILERIHQGPLLMVNSRQRNGLILFKKYHAEFAGPGAAVGGHLDQDCTHVYPVGSLSLLEPQSHEERQKAYLIRRQWIRLTHQFTDNEVPIKRAQMILNQFENYFDRNTISQIPDEAFAWLVGVLPHTVRLARRPPRKHNVKVKT